MTRGWSRGRKVTYGAGDPMTTPCPFCGVPSHLPHETQEACIAALHQEIARMREVVERVRSLPGHPPPPKEDAPDQDALDPE